MSAATILLTVGIILFVLYVVLGQIILNFANGTNVLARCYEIRNVLIALLLLCIPPFSLIGIVLLAHAGWMIATERCIIAD